MSEIELSINLERVRHSYYLMSRIAGEEMPFNMDCWQTINLYPCLKLRDFKKKMHNKIFPRTAGYGGYLALSSKFQKEGGVIDKIFGSPYYDKSTGTEAVAKWLEISTLSAAMLLCRQSRVKSPYINACNKEIPIRDVTAKMVASALNYLYNYKTLDEFFVKDYLMPSYYG